MKRAAIIPIALIATAAPAAARITKTRSAPSPALPADATLSPWAPLAAFIVGGGIDYQTDSQQTEFGFPMLLEWKATERLTLILESEYDVIDSKSPDVSSVSGFGDLETAVDYEIVSERRYRPSLSLEGLVKWPTASDPELGDPGRDYSFGLIANKDLVVVDLGLNLLYTFVGESGQENEIEASLAAEWHLNPDLNLIAEVATSGTNDVEATVGLGWQVGDHLTLEQGVIFKEGGDWELVFGWEWDFGGD
jgi:Putative MetA-pathway of phenol degradation